MASNIRRPFNKYGAPVGMGQQRQGSAFLDHEQAPEEELEPYERLPYNANEANEQRDQPQAHTYSAPASMRLNPALDSAIQGSPRATNSNGSAQQSGVGGLYSSSQNQQYKQPAISKPQNSPERTQFDTPQEAEMRVGLTNLFGSFGETADPARRTSPYDNQDTGAGAFSGSPRTGQVGSPSAQRAIDSAPSARQPVSGITPADSGSAFGAAFGRGGGKPQLGGNQTFQPGGYSTGPGGEKTFSYEASTSNPYGAYGSEQKLQYAGWEGMSPEEKQQALDNPAFKPSAAQSIFDESSSAAQASGLGQPAGTQPVEGGAAARYGTADIPGAETVQWGDQPMPGFNTAGWGTQERGVNTIKNTFGKIASRYDPRTPNATQQILNDPDFQKYFPEATLVPHPKGDQIDFGDGVGVDVLVNAVEGGSGDSWAFQVPGGGGTAQGGGMMSDPAFAGLFAQGPDASDAYALMPDDQSYSEQLRKIIASGQLEGLDQAILGNQQQPQDDPNDPRAMLRKSPRQRSL